jgi:hypothetical protein
VRRYIPAVCMLVAMLALTLAVVIGAGQPATALAATHTARTGVADVAHSCPGPCPTSSYPLPTTGGAAGAPQPAGVPLAPTALLGLTLVAAGVTLARRYGTSAARRDSTSIARS